MNKRRTSRLLSFLLLVAMVLSLMPATVVFAEDAAPAEETEQGVIRPVEIPEEDPETPDPYTEEGTIETLDDPVDVNAEDNQVWQKVDFADVKSGDTIAITMTKGDTTWVLPTAKTGKTPTADTTTLTNDTLDVASDSYGWTVEELTGGIALKGPDGYLNPGSDNNKLRSNGSSTAWTLDLDKGYLKAVDTGRYLGVYNNQDWRTYTTDPTSNNIKDQTLQLWKLGSGEEPNPDAPATPTAYPSSGSRVPANTVVTFSTETEGAVISYSVDNGDTWTVGESYTVTKAVTIKVKATLNGVDSKIVTFSYTIEPELVTIAEALAGDANVEFKVKGVVTLVDGKNVYVQDETGGICLYLPADDSSIKLGDTLIGTGAKKVYKGLPELDQAVVEKSEGLTLTAKETTLGALTDADICTYITIKNLTVTEIDGDNTTVKDEAGNSQKIYKAKVASALAVGDIINFTGALGMFNSYQLRNTNPEEIEVTYIAPQKPAAPTPNVAAGAVDAGTEVKFTSATEGATVVLSDDNGETWDAPNPYTVNEAVTILAKAVKDELESNTATYSYTIKSGEEPEVKTGFVTDLADLTDGAKVVILNRANNMALSQTYSGYNNSGVPIAEADGKVSGYGASEIWTIGVNEDGTYTFSTADGKKLSMDTSYASMPLDKANDTWTVTAVTGSDGGFYIDNVGRSGYRVQWYADNNNWSAYNKSNTGDNYIQYFYLVGDETPADDTIKVGTLVTSLEQLNNGATVLIYSPTHKTAASSVPNGDWYLKAVGPVTDTFTAPLVWTVGVNEDGSYRFYNGGNILSAWPSGNYVELTVNSSYNSDTVSDWNVAQCNEATHTWYISSTTLKVNDKTAYVQAYINKGTEVFSGYATNSPSEKDYGLQFYIVDPSEASPEVDDGEWDGVLNKGQSYVIYNANAEGVLGIPNDMGIALTNVPATVFDGVATAGNGALVFTVAETTGRYYIFEVGGKYLATNNAEEIFLQEEKDEYTKWYLTKNGSGYLLYNKTANYNGTPVCIEYYSGSYSGWTFKTDDADIFRFNFYPVIEGTDIVNGVVQVPTVQFACEDNRYVEQDYEVKFTLDDLAPESNSDTVIATYTVGDTTEQVQEMSKDGKTYSFTLPAVVLDAQGVIDSFTITVNVTNSYNITYTGEKTVTVVDEPFIGTLTPAPNAQTGEDKRPVISAEIGNVGENATFTMTLNEEPVEAVFTDGVLSYQATEDMTDGRYTVAVKATRTDGKSVEKTWSFYVGKAQYQLYFGQLHSHTTYSDGSGSLEAALDYISAIPESANVQFVAFTDHSNYFDSTSAANPEAGLYDVTQMTAASQQTWKTYKDTVAAFNARQSDLIAIAGFEMTWSGGPGHINTFNTPGIVSRNNKTLNEKANDAGMKAYYALLDNEALVDSVSQFNHPGKTFGNFQDFSYWDAVTDSRIYLVEVGNGEGQIGAGGYYPSYEEYILALDKGWHVGPTNNQDNHKGRWGNANDARDVILTDDFSEQGIYEAIRNYRIYATEDKNLEIQYTVNEELLGTIFSEVPEELNFVVTLYDPDSSDSISKVELVANSGAVAYTWDDSNELASGKLEATLEPTYSYYFVRVTQKDGDLAVTAPVWVGESLKLGISAVECGTSTPVTGEEFTLTTSFFNSEAKPATIKSITYTTNGDVVLGTDTAAGTIPASSTATASFKYTPDKAKIMTITVTAVVELDGVEYTFKKDITLEVKDADSLVYLGIDASHYNEYVAGNYNDSMGNFGALAAGYGVRTVELKTSEELIAACANEKYAGIILTVPSRREGDAIRDPYANYTDDELTALKAFNEAGGMLVIAGWSDYYESYSEFPAADHMAAQQNKLLETLGSNLRLGDDAVVDNSLNGGQAQRLYFDAYNYDSFLTEGVIVDPEHPNDRNYSEVYSNYAGCSVYFTGEGVPSTVTPVVYGHSTTVTQDSDNDGRNELVYPYGEGNRVVVLASEQLEGKGLIIVSGAAFMSNFEVQAAASSGSTDADQQKNYSNYKICENLVKGFNELKITDIAEVQAQTEIGLVYTIEGVVTSNASGYDKDTAFFDCIYVQDETAGICCFPVSGNYKIGDKVRITGYTDFYQAEMELQVMSIEIIGEGDPVKPTVATAAQINDLSLLGTLVTLNGTVESFELENGLVQTIMVKDAKGDVARVFIDGYITTAEDVKDLAVGCRISATGLSSYDDTFNAPDGPFPRIRIRDRADIVCTEDKPLPDGYYLIGPDWSIYAIDAANKFEANPENTEEFMLRTTLEEGDTIKVVHVEDNTITGWYPDGVNNEYTVDADHAGLVDIYFKTVYDAAWSDFGGYFWIGALNPTVVIGKSLSLKGKIEVNFYLDLPRSILSDEGAYVTINDVQYPVSEAKQSEVRANTGYRFTTQVKFAHLLDEQVLRVFNGKDEPVLLLDSENKDVTETGFVYRAQDYIEYVRANSKDEKWLAVVNALSDLGSLAQAQFKYNVDSCVQVVGDLASVTADMVKEQELVLTAAENSGIRYYGSSLLLKEDTTIRHYFKLDGGELGDYTFIVDGEKVTPKEKSGYYYINIGEIRARDLDKSFRVEVKKGDEVVIGLDYSALSYAYTQLSRGKTDTLTDLTKAVVLYNKAADAFWPE